MSGTRTSAFVIAALMAVAFTACGSEGDGTPSGSGDTEATEATDQTADEPEEESECLGKKKGPVVKLLAGKPGGDGAGLDAFRFHPDKLRLPAGKDVTLKIVHGAGHPHTFTSDALDCDTGFLAAGDSVFVSFKVPKGTTPFVCTPHIEGGMDGKIVGI